ncbi:hypothetical protein GCM10010420_02910 [Streptomyces glaucosporus]|uniref:Uncharacterized protein n=1 Tax=Streptomyces glaucosporus TaxID=284044 RepID=A0ABN3HMS6_9ACTN
MQNFAASTADPFSSTGPPTGPVDKIPALTCADRVIHGIHRPYYYDHGYKAGTSLGNGPCAQLGPDAPRASSCRLDPGTPRLSAACVRLVTGDKPTTKTSKASSQQQREAA